MGDDEMIKPPMSVQGAQTHHVVDHDLERPRLQQVRRALSDHRKQTEHQGFGVRLQQFSQQFQVGPGYLPKRSFFGINSRSTLKPAANPSEVPKFKYALFILPVLTGCHVREIIDAPNIPPIREYENRREPSSVRAVNVLITAYSIRFPLLVSVDLKYRLSS